uniref:Uncharacterized protein n=1 Tax=Anguilla anguilla TaxID=7936 RepID=A0A0E9UWH1_ANGAN
MEWNNLLLNLVCGYNNTRTIRDESAFHKRFGNHLPDEYHCQKVLAS